MGELNTIMARDGHQFSAYLAAPSGGRSRGAVLVIQEIFGLNAYVRSVADDFAAEGYTAIAPALFDRIRRGIELGYSQAEAKEGIGYMQQLKLEQTLKDLAACIAIVRRSGRLGTVGFCWGGAMSYVAACELPVRAAVVYYGKALQYADRTPKCPVLYHFGTQDTGIPVSDVEQLQAAQPNGIYHLYEAGHGFSCHERASYNAEAAQLARQRTLDFLAEHLTGEHAPED
jgi:carboxymethylenebutenolidase